MRSCESCRHSFPVDKMTVSQELTRGHLAGGDAMTLFEHPSMGLNRTRDDWRLCRARASIVTPSTATTCAHYGSKLAGLFVRRSTDEALYADLEAERQAQRKRELAEAARLTAQAEAEIRTKPCAACARIHDRCDDCDMPWPFCGKCSQCGGGTRWYRVSGTWECSLCEKASPAPLERPEWPEGRCDGCRDIHAKRSAGAA